MNQAALSPSGLVTVQTEARCGRPRLPGRVVSARIAVHTCRSPKRLRAVGEQLLRSGGRVRAWLCGSSAHLWVELTKAPSHSIPVSEGLNQTWPRPAPPACPPCSPRAFLSGYDVSPGKVIPKLTQMPVVTGPPPPLPLPWDWGL